MQVAAKEYKLKFTSDEFNIMVTELLHTEPSRFDMLCHIANKTLQDYVTSKCLQYPVLRGTECEHDIMQNIHLRLIQVTVMDFFFKDPDYTPQKFQAWLFTVAKNLIIDYVRSTTRKAAALTDAESTPEAGEWDEPSYEYNDHVERLKQALAIVLSADVNIYKVLTWLAQFVFMLQYGTTRIKTNDKIIDTFTSKNLFEMYEIILQAAEIIPWLTITQEQHQRILDALNQPWHDGRPYGVIPYGEFYMCKNGEQDGKKSISDWTNRINSIIKKKLSRNS